MFQMAPLNWLMLYFCFTMIFYFFNIKNYFCFSINFNKKEKKTLNSISWKW